jgi:chaperone BCS1
MGLHLCALNLSSGEINDKNITLAMAEAPNNSIILLEDIDGMFKDRMLQYEGYDSDSSSDEEYEPDKLTFSGFLNALDGVRA